MSDFRHASMTAASASDSPCTMLSAAAPAAAAYCIQHGVLADTINYLNALPGQWMMLLPAVIFLFLVFYPDKKFKFRLRDYYDIPEKFLRHRALSAVVLRD